MKNINKVLTHKLPRELITLALVLVFFLFFTTCKKDISKNSASSITYFIGSNQDKVQTVVKTTDGGFLFVGYTVNGNNTDAFLLKTNVKGKQQWYKTYGGDKLDYFKNAMSTPDGGFLAVGASNTGSYDTLTGATMGFVVKLDADGNVEWQKKYGNKPTIFESCTLNPINQGYFISGESAVNWNLITMLSINKDGTVIFNRTYNNGQFSNIPPLYINNLYGMWSNCITLANDQSGNVLIGGISSKSNFAFEASTGITYIASISGATGLPIVSFTRMEDYSVYLGLFRTLNFVRRYPPIKMTPINNGFMIATYTVDTNFKSSMQLIKTNTQGDLVNNIWHKQYNGIGNAELNDFNDNKDGTYLLCGSSTVNDFDFAYPEGYKELRVMLLKVDQNGNPIWTQYFGSKDNSNIGMSAQPSANGGYILAGYNSSDLVGFHKMFCSQLDKDGNILPSNE